MKKNTFLATFLLLLAPALSAQPEFLDHSFGTDGLALFQIQGLSASEIKAALQPDGKIVAVGLVDDGTIDDDFALVRHTADGSLDNGFGNDGVVVKEIYLSAGKIAAPVLQPDGKIVIGGENAPLEGSQGGFLFRFLPDGAIEESFRAIAWEINDLALHSPDKSFGSNGKAVLEIEGSNFRLTSSAFTQEGKILAAGRLNGDFFLACFQPDGALDESFGVNGMITTDFDGGFDQANSILVQPDGKIILAGESEGKFALARYRAGLTLEATETIKPGFGSLEISPNPAQGFLNIRLPEPVIGSIEIHIYHQDGRLASRKLIQEGQPVPIYNLPYGAYTISTTITGHFYSGKFIKTRP